MTPPRTGNGSVLPVLIFAFLLLVSLYQGIVWDRYFFKIIPLKIKDQMGRASLDDLKDLERICKERKQNPCFKSALEKLFALDPSGQKEKLLDLAKLEESLSDDNSALSTYQLYFANHGTNPEAAVSYAKLLVDSGDLKRAGDYYRFALGRKDIKNVVNATREYALVLIRMTQYREAKNLIEAVRSRSPTSAYFMDKELRGINSKLNIEEAKASKTPPQS